MGATAVEYALIVSLIAAVIVASVFVLGGKTTQLFDRSCDEVSSATDGTTC